MTFENRERDRLVEHRLSKALEAADHVEFLMANGMLALAVNRIYYGMFYALSALALKNGFTTKKHGELIGWFNRTFVKERKVELKMGRLLRSAFESRSVGDYDDWVEFSRDEVSEMLSGMREFIGEIKRLINDS